MRLTRALDDIFRTAARSTPGQRGADDFLRAVTPEDIRRLMEQPDDPRDRDFAVSTSGGGHEPQRYTPYGRGYNRSENYPNPLRESGQGGYIMPGINAPHEHDEEDEIPYHYHVVTGPVGSTNRDEWTEHPYVMFHPRESDYDPVSAADWFEEDNPEFDQLRNPSSGHEVVHAHPADYHEDWESSPTRW